MESNQRPERTPASSSDHCHEEAVGSKGPSVTNTITSSETPAEKKAGPTENEQCPEYAPSTSSDHDHEKAVGSKGPADKTNVISGSETPAEERVGLQKNDQRPESTPPTSSNKGNEKAVDSKGATVTNTTTETTGDHMMSGGAVPKTTPPLEGPREPITNEALQGGNAAGETAVTASSASDASKDENSAESVRGPAVLEGSENANSSDIQGIESADQNATSEKSSHGHQTIAVDQKQQIGKGSVMEETNTSESGKDSLTVGPPTFIKPEEKAPETQHLLGSGSTPEGSKTDDQVSSTPCMTNTYTGPKQQVYQHIFKR